MTALQLLLCGRCLMIGMLAHLESCFSNLCQGKTVSTETTASDDCFYLLVCNIWGCPRCGLKTLHFNRVSEVTVEKSSPAIANIVPPLKGQGKKCSCTGLCPAAPPPRLHCTPTRTRLHRTMQQVLCPHLSCNAL